MLPFFFVYSDKNFHQKYLTYLQKRVTIRLRQHENDSLFAFYTVHDTHKTFCRSFSQENSLTTGLTIYRIFLCGNRRTHWSKARKFVEYTCYFKADLCVWDLSVSSRARCRRFKSYFALAKISFRQKSKQALVVWLLFCLVCQFEIVRIANAGSHTADITEQSEFVLLF